MTFLKYAAFTILVLWLGIVLAGRQIDILCIEGRVSAEQAEAVNSTPWSKCPKYRNGDCRVEEGDRILVRECSELSKSIFLQDIVR